MDDLKVLAIAPAVFFVWGLIMLGGVLPAVTAIVVVASIFYLDARFKLWSKQNRKNNK